MLICQGFFPCHCLRNVSDTVLTALRWRLTPFGSVKPAWRHQALGKRQRIVVLRIGDGF